MKKWYGLFVQLKRKHDKKKLVSVGHIVGILIGEHAVVFILPFPSFGSEVTWVVPAEKSMAFFMRRIPCAMAVYASRASYIQDACSFRWLSYSWRGSSAAISITRSCFWLLSAELPHHVLEMLVNRAEMIAHNNPVVLRCQNLSQWPYLDFIKKLDLLKMDLSLFGHCRYGRVWPHSLKPSSGSKQECPTVFACLGKWPSKQKMWLDERCWKTGTNHSQACIC